MSETASARSAKTAPIAVIIPCYNYGRFIGNSIEAVLAQTLRPAELIVVDDGSTDDTGEVCRRYPEVQHVWKENGGPSSARNVGFRRSTAPYVIFPDADDVLHPNAMETLWRAKERVGAGVEAVFGRCEVFWDPGAEAPAENEFLPNPEEVRGLAAEHIPPDIVVLSAQVLHRLVRSNIVPLCSALAARSAYEKAGPWDEQFRFCQDQDMWLRIASKCRIAYVDTTVAGIRRHADNITHRSNWLRNHQEIIEIAEKAAVSDWASPEVLRRARRQCAVGKYNLGQRLADAGRFAEAAAWMKKSLESDAWRPKTWVRWMAYWIRSLCQKDRPT